MLSAALAVVEKFNEKVKWITLNIIKRMAMNIRLRIGRILRYDNYLTFLCSGWQSISKFADEILKNTR